jgi:aryl-alcohol dehydrogenase-like predicted oxidoreductase
VARALELGVNYFDTASQYGRGQSETNLGQVWKTLNVDAYVGTKVRLTADDLGDIGAAISRSLDASLQRLQMEQVDLFQLHNHIAAQRSANGQALSVQDLLNEVIPALQALQRQGKICFYGITGLGDTPALHDLIDTGVLDTAQVCYNLLNPSAGFDVPDGFPAQNFDRMLEHTRQQQMGVIVIRALAAGALSGSEERHPTAIPTVAPIASGPDYATDVQRAQAFTALVEAGYADNLVEAALRFSISHEAVSTMLLGYSNLEHLELAAAYVSRGPLPQEAMNRLPPIWQQF